jgi:flagellar hook-associated protein 3 FlgL
MLRINPNNLDDALAAIQRVQEDQQTALLELATSRRVNSPSDDPAAAAAIVQNHDRSAQADQFLHSVTSIQTRLQSADSTLSSVVTSLQRAISLGVQGGTGTLSSGDRNAIATELNGIQEQLVQLANTSFQGTYLFAGSNTASAPYVLDGTQASGVRYDGNSVTNKVQVGESYQLQVNLPGSQLFSAPGTDVFQALHDLSAAVSSGTGVDTAINSLRQAYDFIGTARSFYGNTINQLSEQTSFLNSEKLDLTKQESDLTGADLASTISTLTQSQTARQAAYEAASRIAGNSLFDYLR